MKKKIIIGVIIAILSIAVIVESILLGVGYYSRVPKLSNGEEIMVELSTGTKYSVDDLFDKVKDQYGLSTLLDMIDLEILNEEYADDDTVSTYVETRIATVQANYPDEDDLNQYLSYFGCDDLDEYRDYVKLDKLKELAALDYAKTQVTEKEIKAYYKDEYVGDIAAKHILVAPTDDDTSSAQELAQEILDRINELVEDGSSVDDAYQTAYDEFKDEGDVTFQDLDYFNKGDMVDAFEEAAFDLKVGEYSDSPVYTEYGYHLIYVYDQKDKDSLEDARETILEELAQEKVDDTDSKMEVKALKKLREDYNVTFYDSDLQGDYERYINYMLNA